MFKLNLPFPPSLNHYWRHVGKRVLVSKQGREYRTRVRALIHRKQLETLESDLIVDIRLTPPDRRRRDVDNSLKSLLDALQFAGVYLDDSQIVRLTVEKLVPNRAASRAEVVVQPLPAANGQAGIRTCLRCNRGFASTGPGNRICEPCTAINDALPSRTPIVRGQKRLNGELLE